MAAPIDAGGVSVCDASLTGIRWRPSGLAKAIGIGGGRRAMNHKRGRPKNRRAGCKLCKPWKANGHRTVRADGERFSDHRRRLAADREMFVA